jgi:hypothetical protein
MAKLHAVIQHPMVAFILGYIIGVVTGVFK